MDRRDFCRQALWVLFGFPFFGQKGLRSLKAKGSVHFPLRVHFDPADIPRIQKNTQLPLFRKFWQSFLEADRQADWEFLRKGSHPGSYRQLYRLSSIMEREAFVFALTGDRKRAELAREAARVACRYPYWDYFLEGGRKPLGLLLAPRVILAMSLVYDWVYERLSRSDRRAILTGIAEKGVAPTYRFLAGMRHPETVEGWGFDPRAGVKEVRDFRRWPQILDKTNIKAIAAVGCGVGALLLLHAKDSHPFRPVAKSWLEMALYSVETFLQLYGKDGSYPEGISYWSAATSRVCVFLEALRRLEGVDLFDRANFSGMVDFALAMHMAHNGPPDEPRIVNFGDANVDLESTFGFWLARRSGDALAQYLARHFCPRHSVHSLIWHDPSIEPVPPPEHLKVYRCELDWVILRTGWESEDFLFAFRSGGPGNHEHADRNSFILKVFGERLLADPLKAPYDWQDPAWILRKPEAHNTVLVDGQGHQYHDGREGTNPSQAEARIVRWLHRRHYVAFTSDATPAYRLVIPDVRKVQRTVIYLPPHFILLVDELQKHHQESFFQCRFHPYNGDQQARIDVTDTGFVIRRPQAELTALVRSDVPLAITTDRLKIPPERGIFPYAEVSTRKASKSATIVTALLPHLPEERPVPVRFHREPQIWEVVLESKPAVYIVTVYLTGDIPEVSVSKR